MAKRHAAWLVLTGIILLSLNLRPAAVSVGPVLEEVRRGLGMSASVAGLLTSLPVIAFAVIGAAAPALARRFGLHRVALAGLLCVIAGLAGRAVVWSEGPFLGLSMLALAGMATANVLLPSLVKLHYPDQIGRVTAYYTTALAVGLTASLILTVPVAEATGSWRMALGVWAVVAAIAALPWLGLLGRDRQAGLAPGGVRLGQVARTRLGLAMAVFFGLQSIQAYVVFGWFPTLWRDAGYSATVAGALVGLVASISIPLSLWLPAAAARRDDQRSIILAVMICYPLGYAGLLVAPYSLAIPTALLIGIGASTFPLILVMIGLRSRTASGTAALSGLTQSAGYLIASVGPFTVGALHEATSGWNVPLWFLIALCVPQTLLGLYVARPRFIEDSLPHSP